MGFILFGAILVLFYIAKIFFPEFIVGVAELPAIVKFGNYVDTHLWAYYICEISTSFIGSYILCSACCRKAKLNWKSCVAILVVIAILKCTYRFAPNQYIATNYALFGFIPFIVCLLEKELSKETFISTSICTVIDILAQVISIFIRDVVIMAMYLNWATFTILLIDTWIWRILLYLFFNNKSKKEE